MSATVVLDTHALVWLLEGDERLSLPARQAVEAASTVWVAAITPWEIGMLVAKGRLCLARDVLEWLDQAFALPRLQQAPLSPAIAVASTRLPGELHGDPADRLIAATARHLGATLITADERLLNWARAGHVQFIPT